MAYQTTGEEEARKQGGYGGVEQPQESPHTDLQSAIAYETTREEEEEEEARKQSGFGGVQQPQESPHTDLKSVMASQTAREEEEEEARKQSGYGGGVQESRESRESPYTKFKTTDEYVKVGYGGEGYEPKVAPEDQQPNYYSASAQAPAPAPPSKGHEGGIKEKIKEKLGPCLGHSAPA